MHYSFKAIIIVNKSRLRRRLAEKVNDAQACPLSIQGRTLSLVCQSLGHQKDMYYNSHVAYSLPDDVKISRMKTFVQNDAPLSVSMRRHDTYALCPQYASPRPASGRSEPHLSRVTLLPELRIHYGFRVTTARSSEQKNSGPFRPRYITTTVWASLPRLVC